MFLRVVGTLVALAVVLGVVALLLCWLWWLWKRSVPQAGKAEPAPTAEPSAAGRAEVAAAAAPPAPSAPDDLKVIEGIGPKIADVLQAAGITTFAQLAATEIGHIEQILRQADPRLLQLADPATWPEQARLAAAGDWDSLRALQDELKAGRRV